MWTLARAVTAIARAISLRIEGTRPRSEGRFSSLFGALHRSRRGQAERMLRHYSYLIAHSAQRATLSQPSGMDHHNAAH